MMYLRFVAALIALSGASALNVGAAALRVSSRSAPLSMGLATGEKFPSAALKDMGVSGKPSVIFFYGADDAPSCSKELSAFDAEMATFSAAGVSVVGVRNQAGAKGSDAAVQLYVDEDDAIRTAIGIEKDLFGLLGGRETYVVDASGTVTSVFNSQFDPAAHVATAKEAVEALPKSPVDMLKSQVAELAGSLGISL